MPACDVSEFHGTTVRAPIQTVYEALSTADLGRSPIVRLLLRLRALPAMFRIGGHKRNLHLNLDALVKGRFVVLGEHSPDEIALGLIGRFWGLSGTTRSITAGGFKAFDEPGYAKAVWNFSLVQEGANLTRLCTETRVRCSDDASRKRFRLYWTVIAPFSGLIRREVLRAIRHEAESVHSAN
jgi:hypothetical protein